MSVFDGERRYFIYIFGSGMALLSIWMQRLAVQWIIWEQTQLLTWNGILLLVEVATTIVISPLLGPFVDRWNIARSMAMLQTLIALLSMLMATLAGLGILTMVPLLTIRFVQGALVAAQQPMRMALTPQLVSARFLPKAIAIGSLNFNLTRIVGPAVGALLLSIYGVDVTLWAGAAGYVPFALILLGLQRRQSSKRVKGTIAFTSELLGGYQAMAQSPEIRRAVIQGTIFGFFGRAVLELFPIMADQLFAKGAAGAGQLMSATGLGAILSALILVASPRPFRLFEQAIANAAMLFCFLLIALMTVVESWLLAFGAAIILGFSSSIVGVVNQTAVQKQTEQTYQGRVMGIWTALTLGSPAIGALVYGLIADWLSPSVALMAGSLVGAITTAGFLKFGLFKRG